MTMTVARLHKMLGALIEAGHGRKPVLVDRSTFSDPRDNDGLLMLPPWDVQGPRWIPTADDDGGTKWNRDGSEAGTRCIVIVGDCAEPERNAGVAPSPVPSITDEELTRRFTRSAYPGPNPMYRCNGCGVEEFGVRNLLVEHALACGVAVPQGGQKP